MPAPKELSENKARRLIRQGLLDRDWTKEAADDAVSALEQLFGPWTWATTRMVSDLKEIFEEFEAEYGEPPDEDR